MCNNSTRIRLTLAEFTNNSDRNFGGIFPILPESGEFANFTIYTLNNHKHFDKNENLNEQQKLNDLH